jgi:micrococcal nuclease
MTATSVPEAAAATYVVKAGDTIGAICSAQLPAMDNTSCVAAIVTTNKLAGADQLAVGQSLTLPPTVTQTGPGNSSQTPAPSSLSGTTTALVARVIDGDTIELQGGARVRYIGMDTPETVDPGKPVGCYGPEASARNKALVEGKTVQLEKDVSETDRYGRLLRYVYLNGTMINEQLVAEGYAMSSTYPPDVKYQDRILAAQHTAQAADKGLWGGCQSEAAPQTAVTQLPAEQSSQTSAQQSAQTGCEPAYPTLCLPIGQDLDCSAIAEQSFTVLAPDPYKLDGDFDGVGCEPAPANLGGGSTSPPVATLAPTPAPVQAKCPQGCGAPPVSCNIKGNISSSGEKIYHVPGQVNYDDTIIDSSKGERWFCTGAEAQANGWRAALR